MVRNWGGASVAPCGLSLLCLSVTALVSPAAPVSGARCKKREKYSASAAEVAVGGPAVPGGVVAGVRPVVVGLRVLPVGVTSEVDPVGRLVDQNCVFVGSRVSDNNSVIRGESGTRTGGANSAYVRATDIPHIGMAPNFRIYLVLDYINDANWIK